MKRISRFVLGALLAGTFVAAGVTTAAPAQALPGLQVVSATTAANSNVFKQVQVFCPTPKIAVGGSYRIFGGPSEIVPTSFIPLPGLVGYEARAYEDETGFAGNWALQVSAMCVNPIHALIVSATSVADSNSPKSVNVACPAGLHVLGTGGWVQPGRGQSVLSSVVPTGNPPTGVTAVGFEDDTGFLGTWNITAYAVCAQVLPRVVSATSLADSNSPKSVTATCPAGTFVHGAGMAVRGAGGEAWATDVVPLGVPPTSVGVRAVEDEDGTLAIWQVTSFAICHP